MTETELDRIRAEYEARDAAASSPYRWDNPSYVTYMQIVERALLKAFRDAGVQLEGARVLDIGAGSGYFLHRLTEYGAAEGHGIDLMKDRVAAGRRRYPALHLEVGSATELPYADGAFDLVTQFTCLSSILDDEVRLAVAREMRRVRRRLGPLLRHAWPSPARFPRDKRAADTPTIRSTERSCAGCSASRSSCGGRAGLRARPAPDGHFAGDTPGPAAAPQPLCSGSGGT